MEKLKIKNRKGQNVVVLLEEAENPKGLAFVMHGLGGFKEQPHIETFAGAFKEKGFTVVRFDTTNTFGESEGNYEDATTTNYSEDLEDVISWGKSQPWYKEPFYLAGHSLGGICSILYAQKHPEQVKGLAPISTVISGKLSAEIRGKEYMEKWEKTGWVEEKSSSIPNLIKHLKWNHMLDRLKYDILPQADLLIIPVLMIAGEEDETTPLLHQQMFFDKLQCKKELHIIKNASHTFKEPQHLSEIKQLFQNWIDTVEKEFYL